MDSEYEVSVRRGVRGPRSATTGCAGEASRSCDGGRFLQVGYSGLVGLGLPRLLAASAAGAPGGTQGGRGR